MKDVIKHEMAARLARIEDAFTDLPAKLHTVRNRYAAAADSFRLLKAMIAIMPDSPARNRLLLAAEIVLGNLYDLANVLSSLVQLELAASDYRVLVGLMVDEMNDYSQGEKPVNVYSIMPDEAKEKTA